MPRKIREVKAVLLKAGFTWRPAKGSHSLWSHPRLAQSITIAGADGDDAPRYLEKQVSKAIRQLEEGE
ncbi:type II toxin-antitoxin system HicA family toxin [Microcoleus sp. FACHB-1515]|uniref:type II toxin-antitoxin system HicA family toxin n=1 Tax=Cyanophyceae TaxID=3028117 RepID=UPI001689C179|nr:type II toxin-antitoxin system HicA family toxin [Microcoleus sp. FACHB-1515]MBD2093172.1 type II toxin-antitoxin system HicA family toxin [Microcoleus sp. FACHB-1515]